MRIVKIRPASKIRPQNLVAAPVRIRSNGDMEIHIGNHFWKTVFEPGFFNSHVLSKPGFDLGDFPKARRLSQLERACEIFGGISKGTVSHEDLVFSFRIFSEILQAYRSVFSGWEIRLSSALSHESNGFDESTVGFSPAESDRLKNDAVFQKTILDAYDWENLHDSIVVFDFFWPCELVQIFALSGKLKERWNVVILDATGANEQWDHTQWLSTFEKDAGIFSHFDFFIAYQDYGIALEKLVRMIRSGDLGGASLLPNVASFSGGVVSFRKPSAKEISKDELFSAFERHSFGGSAIGTFFWETSLSVRLLPFKCHWSGCHFCTINSTHVFPYDPSRSEIERYVSCLVDFLKRFGVRSVNFQDEALRPEDIGFFAKAVRAAGLTNFHYRFRTRFSREYDADFCRFLAETGAVFVGIWLECASDRIDGLINKGSGLTLPEKKDVIANFESARIGFHAYAIFWLPTESVPEMRDTFVFLRECLESGWNFGCTPNTFWLNRGSEMYRNPEKYGISTEDSEWTWRLAIRANRKMDAAYVRIQRAFISELLRIEFLPFMAEGTQTANEYWKYADYGRFYYFLRGNPGRENLFRKRWNASKELLRAEFGELLKKTFRLSPYLEIEGKVPEGFHVCDFGTLSEFSATFEEISFLRNFSDDKTLSENLSFNPMASPCDSVRKFLTAWILYESS